MQIDIRDVEGKPLDWLVAFCLTMLVPSRGLTSLTDGVILSAEMLVNFKPSSDETMANRIISEYGIRVEHHPSSARSGWQDYSAIRGDVHMIGPSGPVAAMRCFAASFMGVAADVPDDLWPFDLVNTSVRSPVSQAKDTH